MLLYDDENGNHKGSDGITGLTLFVIILRHTSHNSLMNSVSNSLSINFHGPPVSSEDGSSAASM